MMHDIKSQFFLKSEIRKIALEHVHVKERRPSLKAEIFMRRR
jgi:hypothetical protein